MREGRLGYNSSNGRYGILSSDLWLDTGLHCGECLQVLLDGSWHGRKENLIEKKVLSCYFFMQCMLCTFV